MQTKHFWMISLKSNQDIMLSRIYWWLTLGSFSWTQSTIEDFVKETTFKSKKVSVQTARITLYHPKKESFGTVPIKHQGKQLPGLYFQ